MNGAELSRAKAAVELGSITDLCGSGGAGGCCRGVPKLGSSGGGSAAKGGEADETVGCLWGQGRRQKGGFCVHGVWQGRWWGLFIGTSLLQSC